MKKIVFGGGCFWGVEKFFAMIPGVIDTEVGYANGKTENPTYEEVCKNDTYFVEVCYITYDENVVKLDTLLDKFWSVVDPTTVDKQGEDVGTQYRTGIYYLDKLDLDTIIKSKNKIQNEYDKPVVTEVKPLEKYYSAEEYHQDYLKKNPNGYCHIKFD
ncbi:MULTISPECIES: peptide-methionine (S)-S-oxide reductase MsrA [Clostridium]|uniref:Peptide methionine sulfoxide reductase MsrA n=1 Tax=Clostridium cibarium TaxID=2762247 RepID=A0ABR8PVH2_9CLOT|nr:MULTISPECIES: peptide-methionine (S)-S-oxide reductase MsrA [Clostridium]MBD7912145.1 peptide-methionine (S)-S-oxide reductase MsrA [Clostridium cibarium]